MLRNRKRRPSEGGGGSPTKDPRPLFGLCAYLLWLCPMSWALTPYTEQSRHTVYNLPDAKEPRGLDTLRLPQELCAATRGGYLQPGEEGLQRVDPRVHQLPAEHVHVDVQRGVPFSLVAGFPAEAQRGARERGKVTGCLAVPAGSLALSAQGGGSSPRSSHRGAAEQRAEAATRFASGL